MMVIVYDPGSAREVIESQGHKIRGKERERRESEWPHKDEDEDEDEELVVR